MTVTSIHIKDIGAVLERIGVSSRRPGDATATLAQRPGTRHRPGPRDAIAAVPTGLTELDRATGGLHRGALAVVAARPSMGKTTLALHLVEAAAMRARVPVVVFSPELPAEHLAMKMLASLGAVDQQRVRTARLDPAERARLASQAARLGDTDLFIVDHRALTPAELRACCLAVHRAHRLGLVVVDSLQCMRAGRADIAEVSRSLKALAGELRVPVVACSQLPRTLERRANRRPVMADLREVGAIERDADLVVFIYRDEMYHARTNDTGRAELTVARRPDRPPVLLDLAFSGRFARFADIPGDGASSIPPAPESAGPDSTNHRTVRCPE